MDQTMTIAAVVIIVIIIAGAYVLTMPSTTSTSPSSTSVITTINQTATSTQSSTTTIIANTTMPSNTTSNTTTNYTVKFAYNATVGNYLVDGTGHTLYMYKKDVQNNGTSSCYGECASVWPVFYAPNVVVPVGLNASSFGSIKRTDGSNQSTYLGWPLYFFSGDGSAGQMSGQGVNNFYVISVTTQSKVNTSSSNAPMITVNSSTSTASTTICTNPYGC